VSDLCDGKIFVTCATSSPFNLVIPGVGGLVCDGGSLLAHPAITAREHGKPCVVGVGVCFPPPLDCTPHVSQRALCASASESDCAAALFVCARACRESARQSRRATSCALTRTQARSRSTRPQAPAPRVHYEQRLKCSRARQRRRLHRAALQCLIQCSRDDHHHHDDVSGFGAKYIIIAFILTQPNCRRAVLELVR
jgi:hypothetical protein